MQRLDLYLYENELAKSRNNAKALIESNLVTVNQKVINKPSHLVKANDVVTILQPLKYVSRAGLKLEKAIHTFHIDFTNKVVLDIGASTGGFTDCALQHGAKLVYALDVGYDQLDPSLRENNQVVNIEKTNVKNLKEVNFSLPIDIIVCDVSFISLKHVFMNIKHLLTSETIMLFLIKPQFELSPEIISKCNASIKDKKYHDLAINKVLSYANEQNIKMLDIVESPIKGNKSQNTEFIGYFKLCD